MVFAQLCFSLMTYLIKLAHTYEQQLTQSTTNKPLTFGTWESVFLIGLLGHIFLNERMTFTRTLFALSGLLGVALTLSAGLLSNKGEATSTPIDYIISFLAGVLAAIAYFSVRKMPSIPGNTIILSLSASGALLALGNFLFVERMRIPESTTALLLLIASSLPAIVAQFFMTRAFKTGEAGFVALGQYSGPVFATVIGSVAFSEVLTPLQWLGALMAILFGVLLPLLDTRWNTLRRGKILLAALRLKKERI